MSRLSLTKIVLSLLLCTASAFAIASTSCYGRFINPITDVCWECFLPITIGRVPLIPGDRDTKNPTLPLCACISNQVPRVGITLGFWEPIRLVDVTPTPYCFVGLGGMQLPIGNSLHRGTVGFDDSPARFYHVHWYVYPLLSWLNLLVNAACVEHDSFDIGYLTELDPTWGNDELGLILQPEAFLFNNIVAQAACSADCVSANTKLPLDSLFWCAGCQGGIYPLSGHVPHDNSHLQAALLLVQRMTYKLHRLGLLWQTATHENSPKLCQPQLAPIIKRATYRSQMTYPVRSKYAAFGQSTLLWGASKEFPVKGEYFNFLIFRKRNCCAL